jgi:hypothetical protein
VGKYASHAAGHLAAFEELEAFTSEVIAFILKL